MILKKHVTICENMFKSERDPYCMWRGTALRASDFYILKVVEQTSFAFSQCPKAFTLINLIV